MATLRIVSIQVIRSFFVDLRKFHFYVSSYFRLNKRKIHLKNARTLKTLNIYPKMKEEEEGIIVVFDLPFSSFV